MRLLFIILCFPVGMIAGDKFVKERIINNIELEIDSICVANEIGYIKNSEGFGLLQEFWNEIFSSINSKLSGKDTLIVFTKVIEAKFQNSGTELVKESYDLNYLVAIEFKRIDSAIIKYQKTGIIHGVSKKNDNNFIKAITSNYNRENTWQQSLEPYMVISAIVAIVVLFLNAKL